MNNMINENIRYLRKKYRMTQEELADKLGVSRQAIAKWETGETLPDIENCIELSKIFNISIDHLVNISYKDGAIESEKTKGRYAFGMVKVGERGQIVIPKAARDVFGISAGDHIIVLGDTNQGGIALVKVTGYQDIIGG